MYFPSTHWSLLAKASLHGETGAREATEELCRRYWMPIYRFVRTRGYTELESQDITQAFLLHLLERDALKKPDRLKGRFRSFLLGALTRFLSDQSARDTAQKRGGKSDHGSFNSDAQPGHELVPHHLPADTLPFDREWAMIVLETALARVQQDYVGDGRSDAYRVLRQFLPGAIHPMPYEEAATRLQIGLAAFKTEVHRMRQRFRTFVREEIAGTVSAPHEIEEEMSYLHQVLSDPGNNLERPSQIQGSPNSTP